MQHIYIPSKQVLAQSQADEAQIGITPSEHHVW